MTDLGKRFPVDDRGPLKWILGLAIDYTPGRLAISQSLYVKDLLDKFAPHIDAGHTRRFDSPADDSVKFSMDQCPEVDSAEYSDMYSKRADYYSIVGSLSWLANMTCFEISYIVSQLSRFVSNPGRVHWLAAIRVLIYLKHRQRTELVYRPKV